MTKSTSPKENIAAGEGSNDPTFLIRVNDPSLPSAEGEHHVGANTRDSTYGTCLRKAQVNRYANYEANLKG